MVRSLREWYEYPIGLACELVELPRSTYHYRNHKADESQLVSDLKAVAGSMSPTGRDEYAVSCGGLRTATA